MTVIAWDGKIIASDKQINCGNAKSVGTKIRRLDNGTILAWDGTIDAGLVLAQWYIDGADPVKYPFVDIDKDALADLIVVVPGKMPMSYTQSPHSHVVEHSFAAWGSGRDCAMGAMHCGASAIDAVMAASEWVQGCGMGVDYFEVEG